MALPPVFLARNIKPFPSQTKHVVDFFVRDQANGRARELEKALRSSIISGERMADSTIFDRRTQAKVADVVARAAALERVKALRGSSDRCS